MIVLVTGAAGFIGMHVSRALLERGDTVIGLDNLNTYYDVALKHARLNELKPYPQFHFHELDLIDAERVNEIVKQYQPTRVVHLAAQAGVRYSLKNPKAYVDSNLVGFLTVLELCRHHAIEYLVYASSSSVYGGNTKTPFSEHDSVDHPVSLYAATKKANELMAHTYSHLYNIPTTGLRFFTVYGPWGRPDMSPMIFVRAILEGQPIDVFNHGEMSRDFTYIDDVVQGVVRVLDKPATPSLQFDAANPDPATSSAPYRVFNIGNSNPVPLMDYIAELEHALGKPAIKNFLPLQAGDVVHTSANTDLLDAWVGFKPNTDLKDGVGKFVEWYLGYSKKKI